MSPARGAFGTHLTQIKALFINVLRDFEAMSDDEDRARLVVDEINCVLKAHAAAVADELCHGLCSHEVPDAGFDVGAKQITRFEDNLKGDEVKRRRRSQTARRRRGRRKLRAHDETRASLPQLALEHRRRRLGLW